MQMCPLPQVPVQVKQNPTPVGLHGAPQQPLQGVHTDSPVQIWGFACPAGRKRMCAFCLSNRDFVVPALAVGATSTSAMLATANTPTPLAPARRRKLRLASSGPASSGATLLEGKRLMLHLYVRYNKSITHLRKVDVNLSAIP